METVVRISPWARMIEPGRGGSFSPIGTFTITVQGYYYMITGLWPVLHPASFELVTGARADYWLVVLVGVTAFAVGIGLVWSERQRNVVPRTWLLAIVASAAFLVIDLWYVADVVIPRLYVLDAAAQFAFIGGALIGWRQTRH